MLQKLRNLGLFTVLISPLVLGEVYTLNKNETVSNLLYDRLKISPIYKGGYLRKVLEFNNLNYDTSKTLAVGTRIRLPSTIEQRTEPIIVKENPEQLTVYSPEELPATPEIVEPGKKSFYVSATPTVEMLKGNIEPSEFSSTFFYPKVHTGLIYDGANNRQILEGSIAYVTFKKDQYQQGANSLVNGCLFYQFLKKQNAFYYGLKLNAEKTTLVVTTEDQTKYSIKNPLIFSFGPSLQWQGSKYLSEVNVLFASTQKVDSNNNLKSSLGLQASSYRALKQNTQIGLTGGYSHNKVEDTVIHKVSLGVSMRWLF